MTKNVFARQHDDEIVVAQKIRVRGLLAEVRSTSGSACMEFVNRDFLATIDIRGCAVPRMRPA
jgi:hypothetical protein